MTVYTWEETYHYEISYTRSQVKTFERVRHTTHYMILNAPTTGVFPYLLKLPGQHSWQPYKIEGLIVDQNEDPLVGADVYLLKGDNKGYHLIQHTTSGASGEYLFYVEDVDTDYMVESWLWDSGLGEYLRGVTDRDLTAVAS
jgi:hypothetical protein